MRQPYVLTLGDQAVDKSDAQGAGWASDLFHSLLPIFICNDSTGRIQPVLVEKAGNSASAAHRSLSRDSGCYLF